MNSPTLTTQELVELLGRATKGPWQVSGIRHSGDLKIGRDARLHMVGPDDDAVAAVFYNMQTGLGFADAQLIALSPDLAQEVIALRKELQAALGHMLNAVIDLETGTKKATTLATLNGGVRRLQALLKTDAQS